jgi:hypothetical protein
MTDPIKLAIEAAFDEFCDGFDLHSNEWLDKGSGEMFKAGYLAALQAQPVAQQPYDTRQFSNLTNQANGYAQQPEGREQVNAALLDACKKAQIAKTTTQIRTTSQPLTPPSS